MKVSFKATIIIEAESQVSADERLHEELQARGLEYAAPYFGWGVDANDRIIIQIPKSV